MTKEQHAARRAEIAGMIRERNGLAQAHGDALDAADAAKRGKTREAESHADDAAATVARYVERMDAVISAMKTALWKDSQ